MNGWMLTALGLAAAGLALAHLDQRAYEREQRAAHRRLMKELEQHR